MPAALTESADSRLRSRDPRSSRALMASICPSVGSAACPGVPVDGAGQRSLRPGKWGLVELPSWACWVTGCLWEAKQSNFLNRPPRAGSWQLGGQGRMMRSWGPPSLSQIVGLDSGRGTSCVPSPIGDGEVEETQEKPPAPGILGPTGK